MHLVARFLPGGGDQYLLSSHLVFFLIVLKQANPVNPIPLSHN